MTEPGGSGCERTDVVVVGYLRAYLSSGDRATASLCSSLTPSTTASTCKKSSSWAERVPVDRAAGEVSERGNEFGRAHHDMPLGGCSRLGATGNIAFRHVVRLTEVCRDDQRGTLDEATLIRGGAGPARYCRQP